MNDNCDIPDEVVDRFLEVMHIELRHWQIVGPLAERRTNLPDREYWNAVRTEQTSIEARPDPLIYNLKTRDDAITCVQWHGLRAALAAFKGELTPTVSSNGGNSNG